MLDSEKGDNLKILVQHRPISKLTEMLTYVNNYPTKSRSIIMLFQFVEQKKFDLPVEIHAKFALFTFMSLFVKCCT